jgi:hypothetical protein
LGSLTHIVQIARRQTIARYFFDLRCDSGESLDFSGADLRDADQAWEAARAAALDLMQSESDRVNWLACRFEVTDHAGETVFEFPFSEAVEIDHGLN